MHVILLHFFLYKYELQVLYIYLYSLLLPSVWQYRSVLVMSLVLVIRVVLRKHLLLRLVVRVSTTTINYAKMFITVASSPGVYSAALCCV